MPTGQWTSLTVRASIKEALLRKFQIDPKRVRNQKFGSWLDNVLSDLLTLLNYDSLNFFVYMTVESMNENQITIRDDWKQNRSFHVDVSIGDHVDLYCREDASSECIHVGFCLALPQLPKHFANLVKKENKKFNEKFNERLERIIDQSIESLESERALDKNQNKAI